MITHGTSIKIFTGNSNPKLARDIAEQVGIPMGIRKYRDLVTVK